MMQQGPKGTGKKNMLEKSTFSAEGSKWILNRHVPN